MGMLLAVLVAWPTPAAASPNPPDQSTLTVPVQPIAPATALSAVVAPVPLLRVVEIPARLTGAQFLEVVEEVENSTATSRTIVIAPSFVAMSSPPTPDLVTRFARASGPDTAAIVLTRGSPKADDTAFNVAALLYARIPQRLLTGNITLQPGSAPETWSILRTYFQGCFEVCDPLAAAQPVPYYHLLTAGASLVASPSELLADLQPQPQATITSERYMPLSVAAFATLFPPAGHSHPRPSRSKARLPVVLAGALMIGVLLIAGGVALWFRGRRRRDVADRSTPPERRRVRQRPTRRPRTDSDSFLPVIGPGDVVDAALRSGFSPEGYVEIDDCLVRATWSESSPAPKPGQTVTARLVNGALEAASAEASTSRMER
jgi:hypothetical protein